MDPDPKLINIALLHLIPRGEVEFAFKVVTDLPKDEECPLCLRVYGQVEKDDEEPPCMAVCLIPCGHILGKHCMRKHRDNTEDALCPYCRQQMLHNPHLGHPARLSISQKIFQRVSETLWYQIPEQLMLNCMSRTPDHVHKPFRLAFQRGCYHTKRQLRRWILAHLFDTLLCLVCLHLFYIYFPFLGMIFACRYISHYLLTSVDYNHGIRWHIRLYWPNWYSPTLMSKLTKTFAVVLFVEIILHAATSVSIIRREVKRANTEKI